MKVNLYLREMNAEKGALVGTIDPLGDEPKILRETIDELGVDGEVFGVFYQFVNDDRGDGLEFVYQSSPDD